MNSESDRRGLDYEENTAKARSQVSQSKEKKVYNLPIVLTADSALALAEKILHQHYLTSKKFSFTLPPAWANLEVGDRLVINNQTVQITKVRLGANLLVNINAQLFDASSVSTVSITRTVDTGGYNAPLDNNVITTQGDTNLLVLDIPLINDTDAERGVYLTGGGGVSWRSADIYVSINNSTYELVSGLDTYGIYGTTTTVLGTEVEVVLTQGELASATTADLDVGYNKALVGDEIIQFETATNTATNTYTLSGLRRGLRGTEWVGSHSVGERFVLLTGENSYIERVSNSTIAPGQTLYFKAPTSGQSLDSVTPVTITYQGNDLKPYAPTNIAATKDEAGNITITWDRRDRRAGETTDLTRTEETSPVLSSKIPLSETREEFSLEIQQNENPIRTVTITNKNYYNYTASEQVADFGATSSSITITLYQVSAVVGNGYGATATLTPALGIPPLEIENTGAHVIQDENASFTARTNLKFIGGVTVSDDDINDATIIDITEAVNAVSGTFGEVRATTASLNQGDAENIDLEMAAISLIREISVTQPSRLRLFGTEGDRAADTADVNTQLDIDEAIELEFTNNLTRRFARGILANNLDEPTNNTIYAKLFNNSGSANSLDLNVKYYVLASYLSNVQVFNLNFVELGDDNGVIYHIGSVGKTQAYVNPANTLIPIAIGAETLIGSTANSIDRQNSQWHSNNQQFSNWISYDLGANNSLQINFYTIKGRDATVHHPRNWQLQASNDNQTWQTLDIQINNTSINQLTWFGQSIVTNQTFRYFRILLTGVGSNNDYYLVFNELEFYGTLYTSE